MKVMNREAAWAEVNKIFPTDYEKNGEASNRAGYPVYRSTAGGINAWISDMGDRLEVNLPDGKSVNIWIEESEEEQKNEQPAMPHYGEMLSKQIRDTADTGKLTAFEKFVLDRGWLFSTEESLKAGYDRVWKSSHGIMITQEEFLAEANLRRKHANAAETYNALAAMVAEKKLEPNGVLGYAVFGWCLDRPDAVEAYQTDRTRWSVNNCETEITTAEAVLEVNREWGFEAGRIVVQGVAYYESTDWNWIRFDCAGMSWLMCNGSLHQVWH